LKNYLPSVNVSSIFWELNFMETFCILIVVHFTETFCILIVVHFTEFFCILIVVHFTLP
jgi:hypothetical protein